VTHGLPERGQDERGSLEDLEEEGGAMNTEQIKRLLALPVKWRRKLAEQEGPGRWFVLTHGEPMEMSDDRPFNRPTDRCALDAIDGGWAWAPCDSVVWIKAAAVNGMWQVHSGGSEIFPHGGGQCIHSDNPIDCALSAMEKNL